MSSRNPYRPLAVGRGGLPTLPPNYEDLELDSINDGRHEPSIEQFEIEEGFGAEPVDREGFIVRASIATKKFANNLSNNVLHPVTRIIDPIYECYKYFNIQYEKSILKLGNPLVVKRLLYVFSVMAFVFFVTKWEVSDGVTGSSGGAFTSGTFFDIDKLGVSIRNYIDPKVMKENLEYFSSMPHLAGTKGDLALSKYMEAYMTNNGIKINSFTELRSNTNYPTLSKGGTYLRLSDQSFEATLNEFNEDGMEFQAFNPNSLNAIDELESFYIYAGFGSPEDFSKLQQNNIDIKGAILLVRYGGLTPDPNKVLLAQGNEAKAVVFISEKFEIETNGRKVIQDDVIQKLNVGLTRIAPGDLLTPGWSSEGDMSRLSWLKSDTTPKIPTIPISYKDGEVLISKLQGKGVKMDKVSFSGIRGSDIKIQLKISNEQRPTHKIWNVVGSIEGREQPEKGIIIGASRDSVCYGTLSTNTGSVVLLELIRLFTSLQRQYNWSPARSIYFVSFDATEYNLAGATEWIENRRELIKKEGFAYIDLSDAIAGNELSIKAHPFLHEVIKRALKKVKIDGSGSDHPNTLYDLFKKGNGKSDTISNNLIENKNYIPFINMMNIPSLEMKFSGMKYPENSCFDNFDNFEKFEVDVNMEKHIQLVEALSLVILSLAEEPIVPYDFDNLVNKLRDYEGDLEKYAEDMTNDGESALSFDLFKKSIDNLKSSSMKYQEWAQEWRKFLTSSGEMEPSLIAMNRWKRNDNMIEFNQQFLSSESRPARTGYINQLFGVSYMAPLVFNDEYEWNTFPSIRDNLYYRNFEEAQNRIIYLSKLIEVASERLLQI
ncbi:uncharacterized protein PRCAT00002726001 [Priceomyces carsonii]|uniref:uncharacterized protein n=1 Tax=Priceomyces carsonii TaxID=28549 RepID=UPI002ED88316|nr:unnamed protein product [Priceomyces carsonii]